MTTSAKHWILSALRASCASDCTHNSFPLGSPLYAQEKFNTRQRALLRRRGLTDEPKCICTTVRLASDNDSARDGEKMVVCIRDDGLYEVHIEYEAVGNQLGVHIFIADAVCFLGGVLFRLHDFKDSDSDDSDGKAEPSADAEPEPAEHGPAVHCWTCHCPGPEFAIEQCGHLTRCVGCARKDRKCPECGTVLRRMPRNK